MYTYINQLCLVHRVNLYFLNYLINEIIEIIIINLSGGQNLERRNLERLIFRNLKIANIEITKDELFDDFIFEFNFFLLSNHLNNQKIS